MAYDGQVVINTKLDDKGLKQGVTSLQNTTVSALKKVKGVLATVGIGVGVVTAVKAINNMIKNTATLTDSIDKQSQKLGMSRKAYQEWGFILSQNGSSIEGMTIGMKTLSQRMDEAMRGVGKGTELFERLGISIDESMSQEEAFEKTVRALQGVENQIEKAAMAQELFGRSGQELLPMLNESRGSIDELRESAYELGLVLDDATVDIGVKLTDTLDRMRRSMQSASARAIAPLMGTVNDMAESFTKTAIPAIEKFMTTAFKVGMSIPPIFAFMKAVVTTVLEEIGKALDEPWTKLKGFVDDLLNMPIVENTVKLVLDLAGDLWEGLKKGVQSGDWSDFWKASVGAAQFAIGIVATISLAKLAAAGLWTAIQGSLAGAGFSTIGLAGGAIAMLSVGLAVSEAMGSGDYSSLASNMIAALIAGFAVGGLTGSMQAGVLVFTAVLNLKLGKLSTGWNEKVTEFVDQNINPFLDSIGLPRGTKATIDLSNIPIEGTDVLAGNIGLALNKSLQYAGDESKIKQTLANKLLPDSAKAEILLKSTEMGRQIVAGLKDGSEAGIKKFARENTAELIAMFEQGLRIQSPSKEFHRIGTEIVNGLESGMSKMPKVGEKYAKDFLEATQDVLGVHSESDVTHWIGNELVNGLINGIVELFPQLESEVTKMRDALEKIWADGEYKPPVPDAPPGTALTGPPSFGAQVVDIWGQVKSGWTSARKDMTDDISDWTAWASNQFMQIGPSFGNAIGAGMRSIGQSIAQQQDIIEELGQSIMDIEEKLSEAYESLEDAQDDYAKAVLSGDSKAIKSAEKRVRQQEKLVKGYDEQLKALKAEKKSVEDGSKAWSDFAKTILNALADSLYGLGAELAARAALALVTFNWAGAAIAATGSAAAFGAAIAVDSWAGSYADGGIIPQVSGVPSTGDRHIASVNPGELILNAAQQSAIAAQLAMFSRLTDLLSSMQLSSQGGINIDLRGATFNDMNEEAVGRAIYHNIKTLQAEGVLRAW